MIVAAIILWLAGIALADLAALPPVGLAAAAAGCAVVILAGGAAPRARHAAILGLALSLGALRLELDSPSGGAGSLATYNDGPAIILRGRVVAEPEALGDRLRLTVQAEEVAHPEGWHPVSGRVLAETASPEHWEIGSRVELAGRPRTPPEFPDFSYRTYLRRRHIESVVRYPRLRLLEPAPQLAPARVLSAAKQWAQGGIEASLPGPEASLLAGVLLGVRSAMPDTLLADFTRSGTTHIIAISGYNISLVAGLVVAGLWPLVGRRWAALLALPLIWAYTLLVGAGASVVRAALMGTVFLLAAYLGRERQGLPSLALAAGAMTLFDPQVLWDAGFQLSFVATAGLLLLVPLLPRATEPLPRVLAGILATTLAAQLAAAPLLVFYFHRLSLVAPAANLFGLPALPVIMGTGTLLLGGLAVWPPSAALLAPPAEVACAYLLTVVQVAARLPLAEVEVPPVGPAELALYYVALVGSVVVARPGPTKWLAARLGGLWPASLTGAWLLALAVLMALAFWVATAARALEIG